MECWRKIDEFEDYYASNFGRIKSTKRKKETILKQNKKKKGYMFVVLFSKNKKYFSRHVHRLVLSSFLGYDTIRNEVNHIDFNRENNNLYNLEWVTRSENLKHSYKHGRKINPRTYGEANKKSKLKEKQIPEIREKHKNGATIASLAREYGLDWTTMHSVVNKITWKNV